MFRSARHTPAEIGLSSIASLSMTGRWQTEAMRAHSTPRLLWINRGQGRITLAGATRGYGPNNLIYIPAGTLYGYEVGPQVFGQILTLPKSVAEDWPDHPVHLRLRDVIRQKEVIGLLDNLEKELNSSKAGHTRAASHYAGLISVFFERLMETEAAHVTEETSATRLVAAYTDLIERDFREHKGVADFARELGVTPTHLTRCCKSTCGRSALSLLNDRKGYEARLLLKTTKTPIQDIARDLGFASAAYFTRSFQSMTGQTPSSFRRSA